MRVFDPQQQIYLAGPFFNPPQKDAALHVANLCSLCGCNFFSPLLAGGGPIKSPEHAAEVYARNCRELNRSAVVLVQLEWLLPESQRVHVIQERSALGEGLMVVSPPLNIPDSGTVWELGYAACLKEVRRGGATVVPVPSCPLPPPGWACTRVPGHPGPCAAVSSGIVAPVVVAYTTAPQSSLNLMLARSCDAYLQGWDALQDFLTTGELPTDARTFKGREQ